MNVIPQVGEFVETRGRLWLVEDAPDISSLFGSHLLTCVDDDAQGETARVLWDAEVGAKSRDQEAWDSIGQGGTDDARLFAAYLRTLRWNTATAADRDLFQAPFRAGIRLDAYQLLPLRKALKLPRVNLLIADDVGLGKTVEAGLVMRELLLRRRVDLIVVLAPPSMTIQWQEELTTKFGLSFEIIDREYLANLRRAQGFGVNPWATGSRFILSHKLLTDETYTAGLREVLQDFRARTLLILDEAHHAAPAGGGRYAIESQFTRAVRDIAERFEHRLFLSATPHNGHTNSFATLLELLDPQRFTRGMEPRPADLEPVMVRRLKSDLRALGEAFPERIVEKVLFDQLPASTPELRLASMFADYGELRERRIAALSATKAAQARLVFVGLQQRLLSSVVAFARTLKVHRASLDKLIISGGQAAPVAAAVQFTGGENAETNLTLISEEDSAAADIVRDDERGAAAATALGAANATPAQLQAELAAVDAMLEVADAAKARPDARIRWLHDWISSHQIESGKWTNRRLIIFTEYEDTRRYIERQLTTLLGDQLDTDERMATFTGITSSEHREIIKRAFNDATSPLRILICTDAAREGINLQQQCHDLVHFDLPWNPSRLEQRNGRIDRKLQPSPQVFCRYFVYQQRPEDIVLDALVRKTETIRTELGAAGQVLEDRIAKRIADRGIDRSTARALADRIKAEADEERVETARRDLDDAPDRRLERLKREMADLQGALERSRIQVGVDPAELEDVVGAALERAGGVLAAKAAASVGRVHTFALTPDDPVFAKDQTWQPLFDELRGRRIKPGERPGQWRTSPDAAVRRISFAPAIEADGRDASGVVQVHLEHRLVRRLLSRFLATGFQAGLNRACAIRSAGAQPRAILLGRLALYGPGATRLHEEIIPVTADWRDHDRTSKSLRAFAQEGQAEEKVVRQLEADLRSAEPVDERILARIIPWASRDVADLRPALEERAEVRRAAVAKELSERGVSEASSLTKLLQSQIDRIHKEQGRDDRQMLLTFDADENRQRTADKKAWERKLTRLDKELEAEPERLRNSYEVRAARIEPIGMVYLWPVTG